MLSHRTHPGVAAGRSNPAPPVLAGWLSAFRGCFPAPVWSRVLVLIAALRRHACLVTRLRIDASLFAPAPPRRPGQMGRPRLKGRR